MKTIPRAPMAPVLAERKPLQEELEKLEERRRRQRQGIVEVAGISNGATIN